MVDRLKTTESISQGARSIRFVPDIMDGLYMRQTAKSQYHYYHANKLILLSVVLSATQGRK